MGTDAGRSTQISKMLKLVLLCVVGVAVAQRQNNQGTRIFGLGGLLGGGAGFGGGSGGGFGGSGGFGGGSSTCRYWCRDHQSRYYCCESGNQAPSIPTIKPGSCPPRRPVCPNTRNQFRPPQPCSSDGSCAGVDKCCYDICLRESVCKPPQAGGFFGR